MTENTPAMKLVRAYDRLVLAVLEKKPQKVLERLAGDYIECPETLSLYQQKIQEAIEYAKADSTNYYPHRQAGRSVIVHINSPLGKKLVKGAFNEPRDE